MSFLCSHNPPDQSRHKPLRHSADAVPPLPTQCHHCRRYFTLTPKKKGYPEATRTLALKMVVDGTNFRRTARLVGVSPQTVINWVCAACDALPVRPVPTTAEVVELPVPTTAEVVELDELYTFVTHKKTSLTSARR